MEEMYYQEEQAIAEFDAALQEALLIGDIKTVTAMYNWLEWNHITSM